MTTGAYRIDLMLHEDTHTNTQTRHTVIDTNRYHCSLYDEPSLQAATNCRRKSRRVPCATLVEGGQWRVAPVKWREWWTDGPWASRWCWYWITWRFYTFQLIFSLRRIASA